MSEPIIGILGAGRVGTALARLVVKAGFDVRIATAKPPAEIALLLEFTAPGAKAETAADLITASDIIILALPLWKYRDLDPALIKGKIVVDAMNYWPQTDGHLPEFDGAESSSEVVQRHLAGAHLVRGFNHMGYHEFEQDARPEGAPDRRAMAVAGDDPAARQAVADVIRRLGFDVVDAGLLASARHFGIGTPIFGAGVSASDLGDLLKAAV